LKHAVLVQDFHQRYYHPSNARIWFYGDDPPEERLRILSTFLDDFEPREVGGHRTLIECSLGASWTLMLIQRALVISTILGHAAAQVDSHVERQPLFSEPRRVQDRYAAGEDSGDDAGKVLACAVQIDLLLLLGS
jgi:Peptidase M16 inactive domain